MDDRNYSDEPAEARESGGGARPAEAREPVTPEGEALETPKRGAADARITVRLAPSELDLLKQYAAEIGVTHQALASDIIRRYLAQGSGQGTGRGSG